MQWRLRADGYRYPSWKKPKEDADPAAGWSVMPGTYTISLTYQGQTQTSSATVHADPRLEVELEDYAARQVEIDRHRKIVEAATEMFDQLRDAQDVVDHVNTRLSFVEQELNDSLSKRGKAMTDSILSILHLYTNPQDFVGYDHVTVRLSTLLSNASSHFSFSPIKGGISKTAKLALDEAEAELARVHARYQKFFAEDWAAYRAEIEAVDWTPFKEHEPVELNR